MHLRAIRVALLFFALCWLSRGIAPAAPFLHYPGVLVGRSQLAEASGLADSRTLPGIFWTQQDSGNGPLLYAVERGGGVQATYSLGTNLDWEDLAIDNGPNGSRLYVADLGDNNQVRNYGTIYRIPEPTTLASGPIAPATIEEIRITYPGGPRDVEALFVDPLSSDLYVVSKSLTPAIPAATNIYRVAQSAFDQPAGTVTTAELLGSLPFIARVTSADISPDGSWVLVRSRDFAYAFERLPNQSVGQALLGTPQTVNLTADPQGEAIAWAADGKGFYTMSERIDSPIYYYKLVPEPSGFCLASIAVLGLALLRRRKG